MVFRKESEPQWEDFSSGTNWDNYVKSCLVAMQNNCDRALKTNAFHAAMTESAATTTTTRTECAQQSRRWQARASSFPASGSKVFKGGVDSLSALFGGHTSSA